MVTNPSISPKTIAPLEERSSVLWSLSAFLLMPRSLKLTAENIRLSRSVPASVFFEKIRNSDAIITPTAI